MRARWPLGFGRRWRRPTGSILLVVLFLVVPGFWLPSHSSAGTTPPTRTGTGGPQFSGAPLDSDSALPIPSLAPGTNPAVAGPRGAQTTAALGPSGTVSRTFVLSNNTSVAGNFLASNPSGPSGLAYDSSRQQLVVTDANSSTASVFRSGSLVATYAVGRSPLAAAIDPLSDRAFIANRDSGTVTLLNLTSGASSNTTVGRSPSAIAYDPGNATVWVANTGSSSVSVLSGPSGKLLRTLSVGSAPSDIAVGGGSATIWVACTAGNVVDLINATTYRIFAAVAVDTAPTSVTWDALRGSAFVANAGASDLSVIALAPASTRPAQPITVALPNNPTEVRFDPSSYSVDVLEAGAGTFVVVNATTLTLSKPLPAPPGANAFLVTGNNQTAYVADTPADQVVMVHLSPTRLIDRFGSGAFYWGASWLTYDPANGLIYASIWDQAEVAVLNPIGNRILRVLTTGGYPTGFALDPQANVLIVPGQTADKVTFINTLTNAYAQNVSTPSYTWPYAAAYDPNNGNVYVSDDITNDIYIFNNTGTGFTLVTTINFVSILNAEWSTGYLAFDPASNRLFVGEMNTGHVTILNTVTNAVTANVQVGSTPGALAYDPANGEVYVPNSGSGNISVLNGSTGRIVATIPTCGAPLEAIYDGSSNHVFVVCSYQTKVVIIDPTSNTVLGNLSTVAGGSQGLSAAGPGIAIDPTNQELFVSDQDISYSLSGLNLTEIQLASAIVTDRLAIGDAPSSAALETSTGDLLVTDAGHGRLDRLSPAARSLLASTACGPAPVSVSVDPTRTVAWVANANGLSEFDASTLAPLGNVSLPAPPGPIFVDSSLHELFVALPSASSLGVVSETTRQLVTVVRVGPAPAGMAFDPSTGDLLVALGGGRALAIVYPPTASLVSTTAVGLAPMDVAFDPANGMVYVSNSGSRNLAVLDGGSYQLVGTTSLGSTPSGVAYDPQDQAILVTEGPNRTVDYVSGWTGQIAGQTTVARGPGPVVVASNGTVFVLDRSSGSVSVLDSPGLPAVGALTVSPALVNTTGQTTWTFQATPTPVNATSPPTLPYSWMLSNPSVGTLNTTAGLAVTVVIGSELWGNTTLCIQFTLGTLTRSGCAVVHVHPDAGRIGSVTVSPNQIGLHPGQVQTFTVAVRSQAGTVVSNATVLWEVIPASLGGVNSTSGTQVALTAGAVDESGLVCARASFNGTSAARCASVTVATPPPPRYAVSFIETGLPAGTLWLVDLGSNQNSSTTNTIVFSEPNGSYSFVIEPVGGAYPNVSAGQVSVAGLSVTRVIRFATSDYPVTFIESGLASGTSWSVTLGGRTNHSTNADLVFLVPNGTYAWKVAAVSGYSGAPSGSSTVDGGGLSIRVTYAPAGYPLTFVENGLPNGSLWTVTVGTERQSAVATAIRFVEPNGSFAWSIAPLAGFTTAWAGSGSVAGHAVSVNLKFVPVTFAVSFQETGLPAGASWSVTLGGETRSSTTSPIVFDEPNATLTYLVGGPAGFVAQRDAGTATVAGVGTSISITFVLTPPPGPGGVTTQPIPGISAAGEALLVAGGIAAAAAIGVLLVVRSRARNPPDHPPAEG